MWENAELYWPLIKDKNNSINSKREHDGGCITAAMPLNT